MGYLEEVFIKVVVRNGLIELKRIIIY